MQIKVYADVLFIINFIMNYLLLWFSQMLLKKPLLRLRLLIAAGVGGVYCVAAFFCFDRIFTGMVYKLFFSVVMLLIAFPVRNIKEIIKTTAVFYVLTFSIGGIGYMLLYNSRINTMFKSGAFYVDMPVYKILIITAVCYILISISCETVKKIRLQNALFRSVEITVGEKSVKLVGLYDTGNRLKEKNSGQSVIIAERAAVEELLDGVQFVSVRCRSIGGTSEHQAFLPDKIVIDGEEAESMYVCITDNMLDRKGEYKLILPIYERGLTL